ncbi:MAG: hypothetical protein H0X30_21985 [Anaerolineae bacterium]|nr:hypothetical protein [Anaerolineae bacterium]
MTVDMAWSDASATIMLCNSQGSWTWEEYHATLSEIVKVFNQVDHRVDLIIMRGEQATMPTGSPMPHFQRALRIMPSNVGLVVLVNTNANGFARALVSMFSKLFVTKNHATLLIVGSLEEAYSKIAQHRAESKLAV